MPDVIEPAASGRAKCRWCGEKIDKGALRFGERVPNPFGDGEATYWFHLACGAEKRPEKLAAVLSDLSDDVPDRDALDRVIDDGVQNTKLRQVRRAERAPTGRARCQHCRETIEKQSLRVAFEREDEDFPSMGSKSFIHAKCAAEFLGAHGLLQKLRRMSPNLDEPELLELEQLLAG